MYTVKKINKDDEKSIITCMITSDEYMAKVRPLYEPSFFTLPYAKIVSSWCIDYYDRYNQSPKKAIKSLFEANSGTIPDQEQKDLIASFLTCLSESYETSEPTNIGYEIDKTVHYFKIVGLENLAEKIKGFAASGRVTEAESAIANFKKVEKQLSQGIDLLGNREAVVDTLRSVSDDVLFKFPGELGKLIRPVGRKDFVATVAPAKRGKSFNLIESALLGHWAGNNVLFISLEMPREQILMRMYQRITAQPEPSEYGDEVDIDFPSFSRNWEVDKAVNIAKLKKKRMSIKSVMTKIEQLQVLTKDKRLRIECFPANSFSVSGGLIPLLDNLESFEDFIPDLIVLDYADIMKAERKEEKRHQIDETWQAIRGVGQERNVGVITASHSAKATFGRDIRQSDLTEDYRKLNHVTLALAINQDENDEANSAVRMSVLADRFSRFSTGKEAYVLQCLDIGMSHVDSRLQNKN